MMPKKTSCKAKVVIGSNNATAASEEVALDAVDVAAPSKTVGTEKKANTVQDASLTHASASSDESTATPRADSKDSAVSEAYIEEMMVSETQHVESITSENRVARDGSTYTFDEFVTHYGEERGKWMWEEAANIDAYVDPVSDQDAAEPSQNIEVHSAHEPATQAPVMDAGLLAAFEGLPENLRENMRRFVEASEAGSRLKLPPFLRAKQRKAVHLWAEAQGVVHRSFGWASRRRLHLSVAGSRSEATAQETGAQNEDAFDWNAWADTDQENEWGNEEGSDQDEW
jgi:hypothetical protein